MPIVERRKTAACTEPSNPTFGLEQLYEVLAYPRSDANVMTCVSDVICLSEILVVVKKNCYREHALRYFDCMVLV